MMKQGKPKSAPKSPKNGGRRSKNSTSPRPKSFSKRPSRQSSGSSSRSGGNGDRSASKKSRDKAGSSGKPSGSYDGILSEAAPLDQAKGRASESDESKLEEQKPAVRNKFSHRIYSDAGEIYRYLNGEIQTAALPSFADEYEKRRAYSVAFSAKRYEEVLKEVLFDSHFYSTYSKFEAGQYDKVMVMLMDFYDHNSRFSDSKRIIITDDHEGPDEIIREIQEAIVAHAIHILASFARCRIRECALSLEDLLSDEMKEASKYTHQQPLYARVNTLKASTEHVINMLVDEGFVLSETAGLMELSGKMFRRDPHFDGMLVFSKDLKDDVYSHNITMDLWLYPQDKAKYVLVEVMKSLLVEMAAQKSKAISLIPGETKSFMTDGDDVLLTNQESASLSSHLAAFINPERKLFICSCNTSSSEELELKLIRSGVKNFELIEEDFLNIAHNDERFKKVRIIMCNVPCSKSAVVNPVDFVLQEGNVAAKLLTGKIDANKQKSIISYEHMILRQAMKFTQVQSVLYFTSSDKPAENEDLVMRSLKEYREEVSSKSPFQISPFLPDLVTSLKRQIESNDNGMQTACMESNEKYLKLRPSAYMNGCFIALMKRQFVEPTAKEVLERANKKGLVSKGKGRKKSNAVGLKQSRVVVKEEKEKEGKETEEKEMTENEEPEEDEDDLKRFHKFF